MILTKDQVQKVIPHREPFLFIDNISEIHYSSGSYDPDNLIGNYAIASYFTDPNHPIFQGHFPGRPVFPGVCQVEAMAQTTSFAAVDQSSPQGLGHDNIALVSVNNAKFRVPILPNSQLQIKSELIRNRKSFFIFHCQILKDHELMSEAELTILFAN